MFQLKSRDDYRKKKFFLKWIILIFSISISITTFIVVLLYFFSTNKIISEKFYKTYIFSTFCVLSMISLLVIIFNSIFKRTYIKKIVKEHIKIINEVKLPDILPKVVYVYTTHNDFMPSRLLQNMKQSYKNIEYWISDGSSNPEVSEKIMKFASKYNVNLFKMSKPSKDKSDNLNSFLKHLYNLKHDIEYIVTSDSDVAFQPHFVETGIKYFYSKRINRLGYVNSLLIDYFGDNLYNYGMAAYESVPGFYLPIIDQLNFEQPAHMYGACSITKISFLKDVNNGFFLDLYEDWYTRMVGLTNVWKGIYSPIVVSKQSMESNVFPTLKRYMRYFDWRAKYFKENPFYNFSDEYSKSFWSEFNNIIYYLPKTLLKILYITIAIFALIQSWTGIFYLIPVFLLIVNFCFEWLSSFKLLGFWKTMCLFLVLPFWAFAHSIKKAQHSFSSVLGNKITEFKPTRSIDKNVKKISSWSKVKNYFILMIVFLLLSILLIFILSIKLFSISWYLQILLLFMLSLFLYIWIGNFSILLLYLMSFVKINKKYSENNFIEFNDYVSFSKIKSKSNYNK